MPFLLGTFEDDLLKAIDVGNSALGDFYELTNPSVLEAGEDRIEVEATSFSNIVRGEGSLLRLSDGRSYTLTGGNDFIQATAIRSNFIYGDIEEIDIGNNSNLDFQAGNDLIFATTTGQDFSNNRIYGDVDFAVSRGGRLAITGGKDRIEANSAKDNFIAGEIQQINAFFAGEVIVTGAEDNIKAIAEGQNSIDGDVTTIRANSGGKVTVVGANDKIEAQGGNSPDTIFSNRISGDIGSAFDIGSFGTAIVDIIAGNDKIRATALIENAIAGDVTQLNVNAGGVVNLTAGDDNIVANAQQRSNISGDVSEVTAGRDGGIVTIKAGDDNIEATASQLGNLISGDIDSARALSASQIFIYAGHDKITSASNQFSQRIYGDMRNAETVGGNLLLAAGNDIITLNGTSGDIVSGDIGQYVISSRLSITFGNDKIVAGAGNDRVFGDFELVLLGDPGNSGGNDQLTGVDPTATNPGTGEQDQLTGNGGADLFILGDKDRVFYQGGGDNDFADILDFKSVESDRIQLSGSIGNYQFSFNGTDTRIIFDPTGVNDLVGIIRNVDLSTPENNVVFA